MTMPDRATIDILYQFSQSSGVPFELCCAVGYAESGYDLYREGDVQGGVPTSFGLIQVHIPEHGGERMTWVGPDGARRSLNEMRSRWVAAVQSEDCAGWDRLTLEQKLARFGKFWMAAQGCVPPTMAQVSEAVRAAVEVAQWYRQGSLDPKPPAPKPDPDPKPVDPRPSPLARLRVSGTAGSANLRTGPDTDATVIMQVPEGTTVELPGDVYVPVSVSGTDGFIGARLLKLDSGTPVIDRDTEAVQQAAALVAGALRQVLDPGITTSAKARQLYEAMMRALPMVNGIVR